jgi:hypothetical protein
VLPILFKPENIIILTSIGMFIGYSLLGRLGIVAIPLIVTEVNEGDYSEDKYSFIVH